MAKLFATESAQQVIDARGPALRRTGVVRGHGGGAALPRDPRAAHLRRHERNPEARDCRQPAQGEGRMKIDAFTHIFPKAYWERMLRVVPDGRDMNKRVRAIPSIVELDARFRIMDQFGDDYRQVLDERFSSHRSLSGKKHCRARTDRQRRHGRSRVALPGTLRRLRRVAADERHRRGLRGDRAARSNRSARSACRCSRTSTAGRSTRRDTLPLFDPVARYDLPMWMHPARGAEFADYAGRRQEPLRDLVDVRLALRDQRRDGAHGVRGPVRPAPGAQAHHPPHGRDDPVLRGPRRPGLGPARQAHVGRGLRAPPRR